MGWVISLPTLFFFCVCVCVCVLPSLKFFFPGQAFSAPAKFVKEQRHILLLHFAWTAITQAFFCKTQTDNPCMAYSSCYLTIYIFSNNEHPLNVSACWDVMSLKSVIKG